MFKINRKLSVYISLSLSAITLIGLIVLAFFLPTFTDFLISIPDRTGERGNITDFQHTLILIQAYAILALAVIGIALLILLLFLVLRGQVFTERSVALIRAISWCVLFIGGIFASLTFFFTMMLFVAFACLLFGLCVRVVKNVIEEAVFLKNENDLTV